MSKPSTGSPDKPAQERRRSASKKNPATTVGTDKATNKTATGDSKKAKPRKADAAATSGRKAAKTTPERGRRNADGGRAPAPSTPRTAPMADAPQPVDLIRMSMPVRWRDLDAFNHVNNAKFLGYLEEARLQWMMTMPGEWIDDNVAPVVAAAHLNYRRPIAWPNEITVELFVERLGNTSLTIGHRIVDAGDGEVLYADGNVVLVWIDRNRGDAATLPAAVRQACEAA